jgi:hypothetical protein
VFTWSLKQLNWRKKKTFYKNWPSFFNLNKFCCTKFQVKTLKYKNNSNNQNSNRAETRKITMIIVLFLIFLLGHLPFFICFAFGEIFVNYIFFSISYKLGIIFSYFSYSASFLVYFAFNNNFRRLFLKIIHF